MLRRTKVKEEVLQESFHRLSQGEQVAARLRYDTLPEWYLKEIREKEVQRSVKDIQDYLQEEVYRFRDSLLSPTEQQVNLERFVYSASRKFIGVCGLRNVHLWGVEPEVGHFIVDLDYGDLRMRALIMLRGLYWRG